MGRVGSNLPGRLVRLHRLPRCLHPRHRKLLCDPRFGKGLVIIPIRTVLCDFAITVRLIIFPTNPQPRFASIVLDCFLASLLLVCYTRQGIICGSNTQGEVGGP